jgi:hypothetical protein
MTDEKIPYIQCLYHTGKKVYKYWLAGLAIIGVMIGLYFIVASQWKQIVDFATTIGNILCSIGYVLTSLFNNVWSLLCAVPWYWWVAIGVIAGPFILVAIWCALKHFDVKGDDIFLAIICIVSIVTLWGIINLVLKILTQSLYPFDFFFGIFSIVWWALLGIALDSNGDV